MSIEKLNAFGPGKSFLFEKKRYDVTKTKFQDLKFMIFTEQRTFVYYETELDDFVTKIEFLSDVEKVSTSPAVSSNSFKAEIIRVSDRSLRIAEKLEDVFNDIYKSDNDDAKIKKAASLVQISNAIVANEVARFRFLNLQSK
jgi:hypothetical protein